MRLADTNILIYAADTSPKERQKRSRAAEVLKTEGLCLSVQVLQEFYHQATRPTGRLGMSHEQALAFLDPFMDLTIRPVNSGSVQSGCRDCKQAQYLLLGRRHYGGGTNSGMRRGLFGRPQPRPVLRRRRGDKPLSLIAREMAYCPTAQMSAPWERLVLGEGRPR